MFCKGHVKVTIISKCNAEAYNDFLEPKYSTQDKKN